jgi:multidrug efflux system membrane fusion protein
MPEQFTDRPPKEAVVTRVEGSAGTGKRSSAGLVLLALVAAACVAGFFGWRSMQKKQQTQAAGLDPSKRAVPVVVANVEQRDLPVYLEGLGSVVAYNTVTVKSRVDGQLVQVAFREGQEVKEGDLLAVIDPRPFEVALSQAEAGIYRDQAQLADAKLNLERYSGLFKEGVVSQQQYDTQRALVAQLDGSVRSDQAQINSAKLQLVYCHITAPISGRIGLRLVDSGNIVHANDANGLLVITQLQPITVIFSLPEDNLQVVARRMREGTLRVDALSRDPHTLLAKGSLLTMDNQIDSSSGTFRLKAVFDNQDRVLWPNQFVNARLQVDLKKNDTVAPASAIQRGSQGTFVYVVKPDKTVDARPVTVEFIQGGVASIASGLSPGEQVVTDGQDKLQKGSLVEPRQDTRTGSVPAQ